MSEQIQVIPAYPGEQEIHRKAGFRIGAFQRHASYPPMKAPLPRTFRFYSLSHLIEGEAWFWTPGGGVHYFSAGTGVLIPPGAVHSYGGHGRNYVEDYICFSGPVADHLFRAGVLGTGLLTIGKARRLLPYMDMAEDPTDDGQLRVNGEFIKFLTDLYLENRSGRIDTGHDSSMDQLIREMHRELSRWWTVREMADFCSLSVNRFRDLFQQKTGRSPRDYLETLRIRRASELLVRREVSVSEAADQLGYRDPYHFSKVFKKNTGLSPRQYSREYRIRPEEP